jgi:hypothetical protein
MTDSSHDDLDASLSIEVILWGTFRLHWLPQLLWLHLLQVKDNILAKAP